MNVADVAADVARRMTPLAEKRSQTLVFAPVTASTLAEG
jgi:hypothetical protein